MLRATSTFTFHKQVRLLMSNKILFLSFLLAALPAVGAHSADIEVDLTGGFVATISPSVATGANSEAFTYSVRGASVLTSSAGTTYRVAIDCVGFDELGGNAGTEGTGRCKWTDADGDSLFVVVQTVGDGNRYSCTGGTGKWAGTSGVIDTRFTYLPGPNEATILGTDEGSGTLSVPNPKAEQ